jgi:hypothetical protein
MGSAPWVFMIVLVTSCSADCELVSRDVSPDGRFEIVLCRRPSRGVSMPGQGQDAPGTVRLRDRTTGQVLHELEIEMIQLASDVRWTHDEVSIKALFSWPLPSSASKRQRD